MTNVLHVSMTEKIASYANEDTPKGVDIPPEWTPLSKWLVGRLSVASVLFVCLGVVYNDSQTDRATIEVLLRESVKANAEMSASNREMSTALQQMSDTLHRLEAKSDFQ